MAFIILVQHLERWAALLSSLAQLPLVLVLRRSILRSGPLWQSDVEKGLALVGGISAGTHLAELLFYDNYSISWKWTSSGLVCGKGSLLWMRRIELFLLFKEDFLAFIRSTLALIRRTLALTRTTFSSMSAPDIVSAAHYVWQAYRQPRDGWRLQNTWIFGKVPNGFWPTPSFSESYIALFATKLWQKCVCSYGGTFVYYMILFPMRCM